MRTIVIVMVAGVLALQAGGGVAQEERRRGSEALVEQETPLAAVRMRAGELGVRLYFGPDAPPGISRSTEELTTAMHERTIEGQNAAATMRACREALYDAAADIATQARAMGANAVAEVDSGYAPQAASTGARFLCRTTLQRQNGRLGRVLGVQLTGRAVVMAE